MNDGSKNGLEAFDIHLEGAISSDGGVRESTLVQIDGREASIEATSKKLAGHGASAGEEFNAVIGYGQRLRAERLRRGLSVGEVARRLRLSTQQINALEEEDYSKLPSGTFLRGFVRNYGSLLQLDTNSLLRLLTQSAPLLAHQGPARQVKTTPLVSSKRAGGVRGVLLSAIVLILTLLGYGVYQSGDWGQESVMEHDIDANASFDSQAENGQVTMELLLPQTPSVLSRGMGPSEKSPSGIVPAPVVSAVAGSAVTEVIESNEKTLHFIFSKESWVEIKDSNRKVIFVKTNAKGTEQVIKGMPPLYLVIGNATGVNLTYNGKPVDLAPYTRRNDDVARFSLE
jgi:cytoskeleton protein RodZ